MNNLINKTVNTEAGIAICKPEIYTLDVLKSDEGGAGLSVECNGKELVCFKLDGALLCEFVRKLQSPRTE